jgi:hypothetical protein
MSTAAIDQILDLMDEAFEGKAKGWHSLLGNLRSAPPEAWRWAPPGAVRSRGGRGHHDGARPGYL